VIGELLSAGATQFNLILNSALVISVVGWAGAFGRPATNNEVDTYGETDSTDDSDSIVTTEKV
jgi:hypothetical protein